MSKAKYTHARRVAAMKKRHAEKPTPEQVLFANIRTWLAATPYAAEYREAYLTMPDTWREVVYERAAEFGYTGEQCELFAEATMQVCAALWDKRQTLTLPRNLRRGDD